MIHKSNSIAALALILSIALSQIACGFNAAKDIQLALAASGPLIESLNLGGNKAAVIADFAELTGDAAVMANEFNACAGSKPCDLKAISKFQSEFDVVNARGHFGIHPKLQTIERILRGLIASALIYYGGSASNKSARASGSAAQVVTEKDLKTQIDALKAAMKP